MGFKKTEGFDGESLTSFIQRFSRDNFVSPMTLANHIRKYKSPFCSLNAHRLLHGDINYEFFTNVYRGTSPLVDEKTFKKMSFRNLLENYTDPENISDLASARCFSGLFNFSLNYCPQCLKEAPYHRLLWQIREVTGCQKHRIKLMEHCHSCKQNIPLLSPGSRVSFCPFCGTDLSKASPTLMNEQESLLNYRASTDWSDLFNTDQLHPQIPGLTKQQAIAATVIYFTSGNHNDTGSLQNSSTVDKNLLSFFRGSCKETKIVHISKVLTVLRNLDITIKDFAATQISNSFIASVNQHNPFTSVSISPTPKRSKTDKEVNMRVRNMLQEYLDNDINISLEEVKRKIGISHRRLEALNLRGCIETAMDKQKRKRIVAKEEKLKQIIKTMINEVSPEEITWLKLTESLGFTKTNLKGTYPKLYLYVSKVVERAKKKYRKEKVKQYIEMAKELIEEKTSAGENVFSVEIAEEMGTTYDALRRYPEVIKFISSKVTKKVS